MPRRIAPKQYAQRSIIYLTFFLLLSIPLVLYGVAQENFDTRRKAFDELELSPEHPCIISLPNVNPYSLEVGKTVTVQVDARLEDSIISGLEIYDSTGETIYQEDFDTSPIEITTTFPFTPESSGLIDMLGLIKKESGGSVGCEISSPYDIKGLRAVSNNDSPEFTSSPLRSEPSLNIDTGQQYEYTLTALDEDGDRINYSYSFTPRADWLKPVIIEDGSTGKLTIKFRGTSNVAASYLANVFIHDGYSQHLRSQSWVISVNPKENDIPEVKIIEPSESIRVNQGESFNTLWEASDRNHILRYELYITNNPANEDVWKVLDKDLDYNKTSYTIPTSNLTSGTYKVIAKAIDNQTPPGIGVGISPEIVISKTSDSKPDTDDGVILEQPQVTNMGPGSTDDISNRRVTVRATIIASKDSKIDEESIIFKVDEKDISSDIKINKISESEFTLIYQPQEDFEEGVHQAAISFADSSELDITKSWNFTIKGEDTDSEDTYTIFGYKIAKNIVLIVGIGLITVILALVTPFIIFTIWKDKGKDEEIYGNENSKLPPITPSDRTPYIETSQIEPTVKEKVEEKPKKEDAWDKYSVAKPIVTEEQKRDDLEDLKVEEEVTAKPNNEMPSTSKKEVPTFQPTSKIVEEPNLPEIPEPAKEEKEVPTSQSASEMVEEPSVPEIPEPEIPEAEDLEKIFQQIQQSQQEDSEQPPVVNE
jgi:hypothetical protein